MDPDQATIKKRPGLRSAAFDMFADPDTPTDEDATIKKVPIFLRKNQVNSDDATLKKKSRSDEIADEESNFTRLMRQPQPSAETPVSSRFEGHGSYFKSARGEGSDVFCSPKGLANASKRPEVNTPSFKPGTSSRTKWLESRSTTPQRTGDLRSDFDTTKENKVGYANFNSSIDRFKGKGSHFRDSHGTGHHVLGHTDKVEELSKNVGCVSMNPKGERHGRFSNAGSIYKNSKGEGRGGIGLAHRSIVGDIFASVSSSGPSPAFKYPSHYKGVTRTAWMENKETNERSDQMLSPAVSTFDTEKAGETYPSFRDTTDRFSGPNSYISSTQGQGVSRLLPQENTQDRVDKMGGIKMNTPRRHGRFSNAHSIYKKSETHDVHSIGRAHKDLTDEDDINPSACFKTSTKEANKWLKSVPESHYLPLKEARSTFDTSKMASSVNYENGTPERFTGKGSHFEVPKHVSKDLGGASAPTLAEEVEKKHGGAIRMVKTRRSRFSMHGGIHSKKQVSSSVGLSHSPLVRRSPNAASPAFKGKRASRTKWMAEVARSAVSSTPLATISEFDAAAAPGKAASSVFKATTNRFTSPGSYLQAPSNGSGPARTHGSLAKGKGALKMVKEKHRRFSGVGSIYYRRNEKSSSMAPSKTANGASKSSKPKLSFRASATPTPTPSCKNSVQKSISGLSTVPVKPTGKPKLSFRPRATPTPSRSNLHGSK